MKPAKLVQHLFCIDGLSFHKFIMTQLLMFASILQRKIGAALVFTITFFYLLLTPVMVMAAAETPKPAESATAKQETNTGIENIWPEFILRPVGVLSSAIGAGFFLATSPFAAIANIPEPHDAFEHTYEAFIKTPVRFTFLRPIGDYSVPIESE